MTEGPSKNGDRAESALVPATVALARRATSGRLRAMGFSGGPRIFVRELPEVWLIVALNRVAMPGGEAFTADLAVSSKRLLRRLGYSAGSPPPAVEWHREQRLGALIDDHEDRWWAIVDEPGFRLEPVLDEFAADLERGLRAFQPVMSDFGLLDAWRNDGRMNPMKHRWLTELEAAVVVDSDDAVRNATEES